MADTLPAGSRVFTIPPGVPFLPTLVDALLEGTLVPGFDRAAGPLRLADVTIFVPTRRSARALAATFAERMVGSATFLPRILPLGGLDALETDALLHEVTSAADVTATPAISPTERRMILTRLILQWSAAVRHAVISVGPDGARETHAGEALLVATTPADAWYLSGELATLLDEMAIEDVDWQAIKPLGTDTFDRYWAITLDFLNVAMAHWPAILADRGMVDPAARQRHLIDFEIAALEERAGLGPTIVAGSTGSNAATARLIAAISRLPQGAVVLPGLDQGLDTASWAALDPASPGADHAFGHPQAGLHRLLRRLGVERHHVVALGQRPPGFEARAHLLSDALRPPDTTDAWHAIVAGQSGPTIANALAGVRIIEAHDEGEEALAVAVALRETLEGDGTAVLVTPDRTLARRVREDLARWGIEIDDSGGEVLATTTAGTLARLVLDCVVDDLAPLPVLALLSHPGVRLGRPRALVEQRARIAEMALMRGVVAERALFDPAALVAEARTRRGQPHAPRWLQAIDDEAFAAVEALLADLLDVLSPLLTLAAGIGLNRWLSAHEDAVAALARTEADDSALNGVDGTRLSALFDDLIAAADPAIELDRTGYAAIFDQIAAETPVRGPARSHPRLKILGLLEFRLLAADRVVLAGLDEAVWPPQVRTDAFLNRPMRLQLGLAPPERRIGQTAHDFEMAIGQPEVIVSRAGKRSGAPTVPSRFLQRLKAVSGPEWTAAVARGSRYLDLARALDRPERVRPIARPSPMPAVALRPTRLSVTRIETLRRDPYAIYAERILRLVPLDGLATAVGPREWGTLFHRVLSGFVDLFRHGPLPPSALDTLLADTRERFADFLADPQFRAFMGPRLDRWAQGYHAWEHGRRDDLAALHVEESGSLALTLDDGSYFTLTANADRIETLRSGTVRVIDYKTGVAPSKKEVLVGFAPQLTLEAAIAAAGGFAKLGPDASVEGAAYVKFGSGRELAVTELTWDDRAFAEVVAEHLAGLRALLNDFRKLETGYTARPYPQFIARYSDYDHLARVAEWSLAADDDGGEP